VTLDAYKTACGDSDIDEKSCPIVDRIHEGDVFDFLDRIPDGTIDLIVTDPPYNISGKKNIALKGREPIKLDFGQWDHYDDDEFMEFTDKWVGKAVTKLRDGGSFYSFFDINRVNELHRVAEKHGIAPKDYIIFHKTNPPPSIGKRNFLSSVEVVFYGVKPPQKSGTPVTFNFLGQNQMHNHVETPICMGHERLKHPTKKNRRGNPATLHPTQKPEKVIDKLVKVSSNTGDLVLDLFSGTGTTSSVARKNCRRFLGVEQNSIFADESKKRLNGLDVVCDFD
jgi:site-specific DNA-methyltransferase (adenine-specific)/modification methylase